MEHENYVATHEVHIHDKDDGNDDYNVATHEVHIHDGKEDYNVATPEVQIHDKDEGNEDYNQEDNIKKIMLVTYMRGMYHC